MTAAMPEFLNFEEEPERMFFAAQGMVMTAANELTRFSHSTGSEKERQDRRRAA